MDNLTWFDISFALILGNISDSKLQYSIKVTVLSLQWVNICYLENRFLVKYSFKQQVMII